MRCCLKNCMSSLSWHIDCRVITDQRLGRPMLFKTLLLMMHPVTHDACVHACMHVSTEGGALMWERYVRRGAPVCACAGLCLCMCEMSLCIVC